ncbi:cytochrome b561 and DOMON domain-containing protein At4g17280 [Neltuma alba]|uniref:cytochrome b561 and DOMON domain-containing protein At4g17280 n=1 Tax=Neltuma alba TaxID=207710 RepID=UPI0010A4C3C8|nr:cytochrome b561 and DOMON domain-containing protein At4g17280-like [Prosopis alba]
MKTMVAVLKFGFALSILISLFLTSSAQTCKTLSFPSSASNRVFSTCRDLPYLSSYLHWTYQQSTGKLEVAYRHSRVSSNRWVAWALNPTGSASAAMIGAQALVAIVGSDGTAKAHTSPISSLGTTLQAANLSFPVSGLTATYENNEVIIFATLTLNGRASSMIHTWQEGAVSGSTPQGHAMISDNTNAKETLNLVSGESQGAGGSANSIRRRRNTHGVLNAVSWGILMPVGAIIARYLKVFKSADPAWFYLHVTCQTSAYIIGVAGWGTGLKLGSDSVGIQYTTHRRLGIVLFCLGTLQVFALLLRPNKDHKYRFYWNIYHHTIGYATIIISIINIFKGFEALEASVQDRYNDWKHAYIGIIAALGGIAVLLEAYTWIVVLKRRKSEGKTSHGVNGVNGYGSRPTQV